MDILQTEVRKLKEILKQLIGDISIKMSISMRDEIQAMIEMPDVLSGERDFSPQPYDDDGDNDYKATAASGEKYQTNPVSNDLTSNHDFLAAIPLSPKQNSDECNLSDLSSSNWSARISPRLHFEMTHERHKVIIPILDLTNLPPDSDDENAVANQSISNAEPEVLLLEGQLGNNAMN